MTRIFIYMSGDTLNSHGNEELYNIMKDCDIPVRRTLGKFDGYHERGIVIAVPNTDYIKRALQVAKIFRQECILWRTEGQPTAELVYTDGRPTDVLQGEWQEVSFSEAMKLNAWTNIGDKYYVVK